jgi:hypothetical protein
MLAIIRANAQGCSRGKAAPYMYDSATLGDCPMSKTSTTPNARPAKKVLFGLSRDQLQLVVGGTGVVVNADGK